MINKISFYNYVANYIQANQYEIIDDYLINLDEGDLSLQEFDKLYAEEETIGFELIEEICKFIKVGSKQ